MPLYNVIMLKIGSHVKFGKPDYLLGSLTESLANNANAMMIYLGAPQNAQRADTSEYKLKEFLNSSASKILPTDIVVHAPYIVNIASLEKFQFGIDLLVKDCERMNYFGGKFMVLHPGAYTNFSRKDSCERLIKSLQEIFKHTKDVCILLETMSGKGSEIGHTFEELSFIIKEVNSPRLGICLDTCHIWEAGYDIVNKWDEIIVSLEQLNLLDKIKVIHVNDSKNPCGAKKDRHENIGKGHIGLRALKRIVHEKKLEETIKILETPLVEGVSIYKEEIALLSF